LRIEGEGAEDKALQLSGTDVVGWTVIVKPSEIFYDNSSRAPATTPEASKIHR